MADFDQPRPAWTPNDPLKDIVGERPQPIIPLTKAMALPTQKEQLHETRRATFSSAMMQALLMHNGANASEANLSRMASMAVRCADLLLAELDKAQR